MNLELWSKPFAVPEYGIGSFSRKEWFSDVFTTAGLRELTCSVPHSARDQNDAKRVLVGIAWGICGSCQHTFENMHKQDSIMHERFERHPKSHTKEKEREALSTTDGLCSSEHGLWGISFKRSSMGYGGFVSRFQVQGNFLLLCSSTNFVGCSCDMPCFSIGEPKTCQMIF